MPCLFAASDSSIPVELIIHKAYKSSVQQLGCVSHDNAYTCQCNMAGCFNRKPLHSSEAMRPQTSEHETLEQLGSHPFAVGQAPCPHPGYSGRIHRSSPAAASCWLPLPDDFPPNLPDEPEPQSCSPSARRGSWLPGCRRSGPSSFPMPGALHDASRHKLPAPTLTIRVGRGSEKQTREVSPLPRHRE